MLFRSKIYLKNVRFHAYHVKQEMEIPGKLLEHVAGRIGKRLFAEYPTIQKIQLAITKVNPPFGADCDGAGVEVVLTNDKTL